MTADPQAPGPLTVVPPPVHGPQYGEGTTKDFTFTYHGYMSTPILMSIGQRQASTNLTSLLLKSQPFALPDNTYNTWLLTNEEPSARASMTFSMGTSQVFGSLYIAAWDFSKGQETPQGAALAQRAIGSFMPSLTFRFDNVFDSKTRIDAVFGGTRDRYGSSGRYDYGVYGATVIGASVAVGETVGIERAFDDYRFRVEEGFGGNGHPEGDPRSTTLLAHGHLIGTYKGDVLRVGLHYMSAFTRDERAGRLTAPTSTFPGDPDGSINVSGFDMRFNGGIYGEFFVGGSYVKLNQAEHVDETLQVVHVAGGQAMIDNFLGPSNGTGSLRNILFQYDYSFGTLARYPEDFWGNGPDLKVQLFGLYTKVHSDDPDWDNQDKLKFGGKITYSPLTWLAAAMRFDRVIPNMNADLPVDLANNRANWVGQSFSSLSTRLTLRTSFVAHETVDFQYTRYFYPSYGARGVPQTPRQDLILVNQNSPLSGAPPFENDVFSINGTMWF